MLSLLCLQSCEDKVSIIVLDMNECLIYFSTEATIIILGLDFLLIHPGITGMKIMCKNTTNHSPMKEPYQEAEESQKKL